MRANQFSPILRNLFILVSTSIHLVLSTDIIALSSAYDMIEPSGFCVRRSLWYNINIKGSRIVPCVTPVVISLK